MTASCSLKLFPGSRTFRIRPCLGCLTFWMDFKLVEKLLQLQQLIRIQMPDPLDNYFLFHRLSFLPEISCKYSRVA